MDIPYTCIKGNFDAILSCPDNQTMIYQDMSEWMNAPGYAKPEQYTVNITPPGRTESTPILISTDGQTGITNADLKVAGINLLDGIYRIETDNCGTIYSRDKAVTASLMCSLQKYISTLSPTDDFSKASELGILIDAIHINSEQKKVQLAQKFYKLAVREIGKLNCDCKC